MADSRLPDLTNASDLDGTESIYVVQGGNDREATTGQQQQFALALNPSGNLIINSGFEVDQLNEGAAITFANGVYAYPTDGTKFRFDNATMVITGQQITPPGSPSFGISYPYCVQLKSTTGAALASGDRVRFNQFIESVRWNKLGYGNANALPCTVSFWVYATITGTMALFVGNTVRSYIQDFTINNAQTWEYKQITIPGDSDVSWIPTSNGIVGLGLGVGSAVQGVSGVWQAGDLKGTAASTNFFASNNNVVCVTGFTIYPGNFGPTQTMSPYTKRSFDEELTLCQRYFEKSYEVGTAIGAFPVNLGSSAIFCALGTASSASVQGGRSVDFRVKKRAAPTMKLYSPQTGALGQVRSNSLGADVVGNLPDNSNSAFMWYSNTHTATSVDLKAHWTASAQM